MAKGILKFFGGMTILVGLLVFLVGASSGNAYGFAYTLLVGSGFLLTAAPLLGFARVIELLEGIYENTRGTTANLVAGNIRDGDANLRSYIRRYKPAFSSKTVYEVNFDGQTTKFNSDAEAVAYVAHRVREQSSS